MAESQSYHITIDGYWYDELIREKINEGDFDTALDLVREMTDCLDDITDTEREQLEFDIMNGTRHFFTAEDGTIGISDPE